VTAAAPATRTLAGRAEGGQDRYWALRLSRSYPSSPPGSSLEGSRAAAARHPHATPITGPVGTPLCWTQLNISAACIISCTRTSDTDYRMCSVPWDLLDAQRWDAGAEPRSAWLGPSSSRGLVLPCAADPGSRGGWRMQGLSGIQRGRWRSPDRRVRTPFILNLARLWRVAQAVALGRRGVSHGCG
jgi:hypothetical protein